MLKRNRKACLTRAKFNDTEAFGSFRHLSKLIHAEREGHMLGDGFVLCAVFRRCQGGGGQVQHLLGMFRYIRLSRCVFQPRGESFLIRDFQLPELDDLRSVYRDRFGEIYSAAERGVEIRKRRTIWTDFHVPLQVALSHRVSPQVGARHPHVSLRRFWTRLILGVNGAELAALSREGRTTPLLSREVVLAPRRVDGIRQYDWGIAHSLAGDDKKEGFATRNQQARLFCDAWTAKLATPPAPLRIHCAHKDDRNTRGAATYRCCRASGVPGGGRAAALANGTLSLADPTFSDLSALGALAGMG